jgi:hypothetical protein
MGRFGLRTAVSQEQLVGPDEQRRP